MLLVPDSDDQQGRRAGGTRSQRRSIGLVSVIQLSSRNTGGSNGMGNIKVARLPSPSQSREGSLTSISVGTLKAAEESEEEEKEGQTAPINGRQNCNRWFVNSSSKLSSLSLDGEDNHASMPAVYCEQLDPTITLAE